MAAAVAAATKNESVSTRSGVSLMYLYKNAWFFSSFSILSTGFVCLTSMLLLCCCFFLQCRRGSESESEKRRLEKQALCLQESTCWFKIGPCVIMRHSDVLLHSKLKILKRQGVRKFKSNTNTLNCIYSCSYTPCSSRQK